MGHELNLVKWKIMYVGQHNPGYEYFIKRNKAGYKEETNIGITVTRNLKPIVQCSKVAGRAMTLRTNQA
jgi:hypothetical protein